MAERVEERLRDRLSRFEDRLTRVEVHLSDVNGPRSGADMRCSIEARPAGLDPIAASDEAATVDQEVDGAADKLVTAIERTFGKSTTRKGHRSRQADHRLPGDHPSSDTSRRGEQRGDSCSAPMVFWAGSSSASSQAA
jgi:ribosome-associated translation inhibitor RaiA